MKGGTRGNGREEYLSSFGSLVISLCEVFLACPSHPAPTISDPPREAKAREAEVELKRATVSNKAWSLWKAFFVDGTELGC
jgi:hypothetical protein